MFFYDDGQNALYSCAYNVYVRCSFPISLYARINAYRTRITVLLLEYYSGLFCCCWLDRLWETLWRDEMKILLVVRRVIEDCEFLGFIPGYNSKNKIRLFLYPWHARARVRRLQSRRNVDGLGRRCLVVERFFFEMKKNFFFYWSTTQW